MKSVFDLNPTESELQALFYSLEAAEEARKERADDPPQEDPLVPYLMILREELDQAKEYVNQMEDTELAQSILSDIAKAEQSLQTGETVV